MHCRLDESINAIRFTYFAQLPRLPKYRSCSCQSITNNVIRHWPPLSDAAHSPPTQTLFAPEHLKNLGQLCFDKNRELLKNSF